MDANFLNCIEGLYGEDYTTALLGYLLEYSENMDLLNIFHCNIVEKSVSNQKKIKNGQFDLCIENNSNCIVIENKFYAPFTYVRDKHQLKRYAEWLSTQDEKNKVLICLCLEARKNEIKSIFSELQENKIKYEIICWENVIDILNKGDEIQKGLASFVTERYLRRVFFDITEVKKMFNIETAKAYNKILDMVDRVRDLIKDENLSIGNIKQEERAYGFYFHKKSTEYWFGFEPYFWELTGIPFDLQLGNKPKNFNPRFNYTHGSLYGKHVIFDKDEITKDSKLASVISEICNN